MNPAFFGISCPVFSVSWLESSDEAATNESFALFSGGGGAAKTGVHNKISINKITLVPSLADGVSKGTVPILEEISSSGSGDEICTALDVDSARTGAKIQLVAGGIGCKLHLFGVTSNKTLVRLTDEGVSTIEPDAKTTDKMDLNCVAFDRSSGGGVVAAGSSDGTIRIYRIENTKEIQAALAKYTLDKAEAVEGTASSDKDENKGSDVDNVDNVKGASGAGDIDGSSNGEKEKEEQKDGQAIAVSQDSQEEKSKTEDKKKRKKESPPPQAPLLASPLLKFASHVTTLKGHTSDVTALHFDSTGRRLCSSSKDGTARLWSTISGKELCVLPTTSGLPPVYNKYKRPLQQMCRACAFSPCDDDLVYTLQNASIGSSYVTIWALQSSEKDTKDDDRKEVSVVCEPLKVGVVCRSPVPCMALSPDGARIATGDVNGAITVSDARTLRRLKSYEAHQLPCTCLSIASRSSQPAYDIISGSGDKTLIVASSHKPEVSFHILLIIILIFVVVGMYYGSAAILR